MKEASPIEEFDGSGDYVLTDDSLPDVPKADIHKYWIGQMNKEGVDRLTPAEYKRMGSE